MSNTRKVMSAIEALCELQTTANNAHRVNRIAMENETSIPDPIVHPPVPQEQIDDEAMESCLEAITRFEDDWARFDSDTPFLDAAESFAIDDGVAAKCDPFEEERARINALIGA